MNLHDAASLARSLMVQHGLNDWRFAFDNSRCRFGVCKWQAKTVGLSRHLTQLNEETQVRDTILHEIAHALAGRTAGHGPIWKSMTAVVGANPQRCYDHGEVVTPPLPFLCKCLTCGHSRQVARRSRRHISCGRCAKAYDPRFPLVYERNLAYTSSK